MKIFPNRQIYLLLTLIILTGCNIGAETQNQKKSQEINTAESISTSNHQKTQQIEHRGIVFDLTTEDKNLHMLGLPTRAQAAYYRALLDYKLEALAKSGDKMAASFLVERMADEALILQRARNADGNFPDGIKETDATGNIGKMALYLSSLEQDPRNAMAGYLWGLSKAASIYGGRNEPIVAGIRLAGLRGDNRAIEFERNFRMNHHDLNEAYIDMYFESGRHEMEIAERPRNP